MPVRDEGTSSPELWEETGRGLVPPEGGLGRLELTFLQVGPEPLDG